MLQRSLAGKRIVLVAGEDEYKSEVTLPNLAEELTHRFGASTTMLTSHPDPKNPSNIPGLEALATADLAVFYLRFRTLPKEQVQHIKAYLDAGKPVVGFRTTTHAFRYPAEHELIAWNNFGAEVLGAPWIKHYGHSSSTDVFVKPGVETHPILKGVPAQFHVRSWLYHVLPDYPPASAEVLLLGKSVGPGSGEEAERPINPVAWTYQHVGGGRVFTTTMGHPEDFDQPGFRQLVFNGIHWALG